MREHTRHHFSMLGSFGRSKASTSSNGGSAQGTVPYKEPIEDDNPFLSRPGDEDLMASMADLGDMPVEDDNPFLEDTHFQEAVPVEDDNPFLEDAQRTTDFTFKNEDLREAETLFGQAKPFKEGVMIGVWKRSNKSGFKWGRYHDDSHQPVLLIPATFFKRTGLFTPNPFLKKFEKESQRAFAVKEDTIEENIKMDEYIKFLQEKGDNQESDAAEGSSSDDEEFDARGVAEAIDGNLSDDKGYNIDDLTQILDDDSSDNEASKSSDDDSSDEEGGVDVSAIAEALGDMSDKDSSSSSSDNESSSSDSDSDTSDTSDD